MSKVIFGDIDGGWCNGDAENKSNTVWSIYAWFVVCDAVLYLGE